MLKLEALDAESGDCLLVHHGPDDQPGLILIDGGMPGAYASSLKPRLLELRAERDPRERDPLAIGLVVVTHVDRDHLGGIRELLDDLRDAKEHKQPRLCAIDEIWFNAFDDLLKNREWTRVENAAAAGYPASLALVASVNEGVELRESARYLGMAVNASFPSTFAACPESSCLEVGWEDLTITLLAPTSEELAAFEGEWNDWLARGAPADAGKINDSSVVLLIEAETKPGEKKSLLLPGDAHGDIVVKRLESLGFLSPGGVCEVDVMKPPHHCSERSVTKALFERVHAKEYVVCADGSNGNPDEKALAWLWEARGPGDYTVHVTFPRDAYKQVTGASAKERDRARTLERAQNQLDGYGDKGLRVRYGDPGPSRVTLDLGA